MPEPPKPIKVFFSYAHADARLRNKLEQQLTILKQQNQITTWHDLEIGAGKDWSAEINTNLASADIILLLVSPDFMASQYCYSVEVKEALKRHEEKTARVIPIILRPVFWEGAPFSKLQALPRNAKPVTLWSNQDQAFLDIARGIRGAVEALSSPSRLITLEDKADYLDKGNMFLSLEQYEEAQKAYQQALQHDATFTAAYVGLGNIDLRWKRYEEALSNYNRALNLDPTLAAAYNGKGEALAELQRNPEAFNSFMQALQLDSTFTSAYVGLGNIHLRWGRYEEALTNYNQALKLDPTLAAAYNGKGEALVELQRYSEALANFDYAIELAPRHIASYINKGSALSNLKQYEEALATFEQALRLDPDSEIASHGKSAVFYQLDLQASTPKHFILEPDDKLPDGYISIHMSYGRTIALRPSSYKNLQRILDDLYIYYLNTQYDAHTYGSAWILTSKNSGIRHVIGPWGALIDSTMSKPFRLIDASWKALSPESYGLIPGTRWQILDKLPIPLFGLATNDFDTVQSIYSFSKSKHEYQKLMPYLEKGSKGLLSVDKIDPSRFQFLILLSPPHVLPYNRGVMVI